jgi:hypothetical protein
MGGHLTGKKGCVVLRMGPGCNATMHQKQILLNLEWFSEERACPVQNLSLSIYFDPNHLDPSVKIKTFTHEAALERRKFREVLGKCPVAIASLFWSHCHSFP